VDGDLLKIEFQNLILNTNVDVELTGFDCGQVDLILSGEKTTKDSDEEIAVEAGPTVTRPGDIWQLGPHRITCADAREDYSALMQGRQAQIAFTDPPYNVRIDGNVTGNGRIHHPEFAMASGEMSEAEFTNFLLIVLRRLSAATTNGSVHYVAMDFRHMQELLAAGLQVYDSLLNLSRLGQGKWRHGISVSQSSRVDLRLQKWEGPAQEQCPTRSFRPKPYQCMAVSGR
jgi:hypothetical protein